MIWGKIIGALLGFVLGHNSPLGALVGLVIGHWVDKKLSAQAGQAKTVFRRLEQRQQLFTVSVVTLAAKLAKIDGHVVRAEIDAFKTAIAIPPAQRASIAALYDEAKKDSAGYEDHARRLADAFADNPLLLAEVLAMLHRIALADGALAPEERTFLETVAGIFGLTGRRFGDEAPRAPSEENDPYAVLGVPRTASSAEIKAVWRKLTREHHPDTMIAKGVPKEYVDRATSRMAAINAAYDRIRAERGED